MKLKQLTIRIDMPPETPGDLADAIQDVANAVRAGRIPTDVWDRNGAMVGKVLVEETKPWPYAVAQQVYELALELLKSLEEVLSSDPDMPSHAETVDTAERRLNATKKYLREEELMDPDPEEET